MNDFDDIRFYGDPNMQDLHCEDNNTQEKIVALEAKIAELESEKEFLFKELKIRDEQIYELTLNNPKPVLFRDTREI